MPNGVPKTRVRQRPGSTGMENFNEPIVVYDLETHEVGGVEYIVQATHVSGKPGNFGEFSISAGEELERLFVDFDSTGTVSEATEESEKTTYEIGHALEVLRALPYQINENTKVTLENAFGKHLETL